MGFLAIKDNLATPVFPFKIVPPPFVVPSGNMQNNPPFSSNFFALIKTFVDLPLFFSIFKCPVYSRKGVKNIEYFFALSIAFYCVIFLPGIERFKQDQITQQSRADRERVMEEQIKQGYYASC